MYQQLIKLGLNEHEAKVYLATLELGSSSVATIARTAGVKRPTTYLALEHLAEKGMVSEVVDSKEKKFRAEEPDRLAKLTRKMRRRVIEAEIELEKLMPGLKAIQKKLVQPPKLTFYQGMEGIKTIIEEASGHPEPWYYFGSAEEFMKAMPPKEAEEFVLETRELRKKAGRPLAKFISDKGYNKIQLFEKYEPAVRQVRFLPELLITKSALIIYGNKLGVISLGQAPFVSVVESTEIVELLKLMYQIIWANLPEERTDRQRFETVLK